MRMFLRDVCLSMAFQPRLKLQSAAVMLCGPFFTLRYRAQKERVQKHKKPSNSHPVKLLQRTFLVT